MKKLIQKLHNLLPIRLKSQSQPSKPLSKATPKVKSSLPKAKDKITKAHIAKYPLGDGPAH